MRRPRALCDISKALLLMILLCLHANVAHAAGRAIFGAGLVSCGEWQKFKTTNDRASLFQIQAWVDGFLSGQNLFAEGSDFLVSKPNSTALYAWIDNYCAANPLDTIAKATVSLRGELETRAK
ncbi:hypothetical protein IVB02_05155 [Bradyrhizobium sp. 166]|uniref:hypothetical protein n=1 Tax=Bradyrhizobium sp. 166 TaxID=2782638 RepID=UPI001FF79960|nr:hypothetical protein [Bradyrhizobium sp. 166]MCK1600823.1 hypothetical protein [Bradyrhizobium sp. 166]